MSLSRYERETVISYNEEESTANIFSCSQPMIKKILALGGTKKGDGASVDIPKSWIRISPSREVSQAERKRRSENMKKVRVSQ